MVYCMLPTSMSAANAASLCATAASTNLLASATMQSVTTSSLIKYGTALTVLVCGLNGCQPTSQPREAHEVPIGDDNSSVPSHQFQQDEPSREQEIKQAREYAARCHRPIERINNTSMPVPSTLSEASLAEYCLDRFLSDYGLSQAEASVVVQRFYDAIKKKYPDQPQEIMLKICQDPPAKIPLNRDVCREKEPPTEGIVGSQK